MGSAVWKKKRDNDNKCIPRSNTIIRGQTYYFQLWITIIHSSEYVHGVYYRSAAPHELSVVRFGRPNVNVFP